MNVRIVGYTPEQKEIWNLFVKEAKNGLFLFHRDYMDYHADRFEESSLLFYKEDELQAVLPASKKGNVITSHAGLTFGGLLLSKRASAAFVLEVFRQLLLHLKEQEFEQFVYKAIPHIYHQQPSGEDLYALFRSGAALYRRDIGSVIDLTNKPLYTKGTKYNLGKGRKAGLRVEESADFAAFMTIEEKLLRTKYDAKPTHSGEEISMLAGRFPDNIKLYLVHQGDECLGGTVTFQTASVIHTQYIGITDKGKEVGALDVVIDHLLQNVSGNRRWFSFGISTVQEGQLLNEGLIRNKESFGARAIVHDFYKIDLA
jgi:hypothetical protein